MQLPLCQYPELGAPLIRLGELELDATRRRAARAGREIHLTPREYSLLEILVRHEGRVLSPRSLYERISKVEEEAASSLQLDMEALQEKINGRGEPTLIFAAGSVGYVLHAPNALVTRQGEPKARRECREGAEA